MINNTKQLQGGKVKKLASNAMEAIGNTHAQGGIKLTPNAEVEDKEVITDHDDSTAIFSNKLGYANIAKRLAKAKGLIEDDTVNKDEYIDKINANVTNDYISKNTVNRQSEVAGLNIKSNLSKIANIDASLKKLAIIQELEKDVTGLENKSTKYGFGDWFGSEVGNIPIVGGVADQVLGLKSQEEQDAANQLNANKGLAEEELAAQNANMAIFQQKSDDVFAKYKPIHSNFSNSNNTTKFEDGDLNTRSSNVVQPNQQSNQQNDINNSYVAATANNPVAYTASTVDPTKNVYKPTLAQVNYDITADQSAIAANQAATNQSISENTSDSATARRQQMQVNQAATQQQGQVLQNKTNQETAQRAGNVNIVNQGSQFNAQMEGQIAEFNTQATNTANQFNTQTQQQTSEFNAQSVNAFNQNIYNQDIQQNEFQTQAQLANLNNIYGGAKFGGIYGKYTNGDIFDKKEKEDSQIVKNETFGLQDIIPDPVKSKLGRLYHKKLAKLGYGGILDQYYANEIGATDKYWDYMTQRRQKTDDDATRYGEHVGDQVFSMISSMMKMQAGGA